MAKVLTEMEVLRIRELHERKMSARELADFFDVSVETVRRVLRGETWRHVKVVERVPEETIAASVGKVLAVLEGECKEENGPRIAAETPPEVAKRLKEMGLG